MSADERFVEADSGNLLKVDVFMTGEYLNTNYCCKRCLSTECESTEAIPLLQCSSIGMYKGAFWFSTYFSYHMLWQHQ
jgi:hypothetical protein